MFMLQKESIRYKADIKTYTDAVPSRAEWSSMVEFLSCIIKSNRMTYGYFTKTFKKPDYDMSYLSNNDFQMMQEKEILPTRSALTH